MRAYEFTDIEPKQEPGTPLSFPAGTSLVDVSDVYDWYKLGMVMSNLKDADPRTFNQGVPHTIIAMNSEEEEAKLRPLLQRLGFNLHDIDNPEDYKKAMLARDVIKKAESLGEDWQSVNKKDKTDGMSKKAVSAYRRENPGSKLKTAVTKKPSELKAGSKDSKRRKSFCARSNGQKKMHNIDCSKDPDKAICKARRRWNC